MIEPDYTDYFKFDYGAYKSLELKERHMIDEYYINYDSTPLAEYLRTNKDEISQGMCDFIADILAGKIKRPNGKKTSTIKRDIEIVFMVDGLRRGGDTLTASRNSGAATIVAEKLGIGEDAVIKAYQRGVKYAEEHGAEMLSPDGDIIGFYDPQPPDPEDFMGE